MLARICEGMNCKLEDIMELVPDDEETECDQKERII